MSAQNIPGMEKLGYTWYYKDWSTSNTVFDLTLPERGLYREIIDLAYMDNNTIQYDSSSWARRFNSTIEEIEKIVEKLSKIRSSSGSFLITITGNTISVPSCEKRIKKRDSSAENGKKGGRPKKEKTQKKPKVKPNQNPDRNLNKTQTISKEETQRKREKEIEIESKIEKETINYFPKKNTSKTSNSDRVNTFPANENFAGDDDHPYEEILEVSAEEIGNPPSPESNQSSETEGGAAGPEKPKRKSVAKKKDPSEYSIVHKIRLMLEEMWTDPPIIWSSARAREAKVIADAIMAMSRAKKGVDASDDDILKGLQYVLWCAGNIPFYHDKIRNLGLIGRNIETIIIQGKGEGKFMPNGKMSTAARNQFLDDVEQEMRAQMRAGKISLDDFKLS